MVRICAAGRTAMSVLVLTLLLLNAALVVAPHCLKLAGSPNSGKPTIAFGKNGSFKIVIFADLHYGENAWDDWGPRQDSKSDRVMSDILDAEKPDFVIYLGDVLTANNRATKNATQYWKQAISPTAQRSIPWASVFGNHDDAYFEWPPEWFGPSGIPQSSAGQYGYFQGTTRIELMEEDVSHPLSTSSQGPEQLWPGVSNYAIQVASSHPGSAAAILYFLDSGGGTYPEVISASQASWFQNISSQLNPENKIQEFIFWHIPSKAYAAIAPKPGTAISPPCIGSINKEAVANQSAEWGIMNILLNRPSAKAIVVGHNHGLDWCCPKGSLWLCFARHSGYGGYGTWTRGARVMELYENGSNAKTWIRLEDGSIQSSFVMSRSTT